LKLVQKEGNQARVAFGSNQAYLEFVELGKAIDHGTAFGRIAFATPRVHLPAIQAAVQSKGYTVLTPLISLDTPGKATVEVSVEILQCVCTDLTNVWNLQGCHFGRSRWL
jgi:hypothetical protein